MNSSSSNAFEKKPSENIENIESSGKVVSYFHIFQKYRGKLYTIKYYLNLLVLIIIIDFLSLQE